MARRIFLSFAAEDRMQVQGFRLLRWNTNIESDFFDQSLLNPVQSVNINYIKQSILAKLEGTTVTVVLLGQTTHASGWVAWEIQKSIERGNGLLGIRLKGQDQAPVPQAMNIPRARVGSWLPEQFANWIEQAAMLAGK